MNVRHVESEISTCDRLGRLLRGGMVPYLVLVPWALSAVAQSTATQSPQPLQGPSDAETSKPERPAETKIAPEHHAWGRFEPGAWKRVRVVTEALDEEGLVKSTSFTETKASLMAVEEDGVTLKLEVVHEVAGNRFDGEPRIVKQGFHGELICQDLKIKESETGQVVIEGRRFPCTILRVECAGPTSNTLTKVYYSAEFSPYILKRENTTTDLEGKEVLSTTVVEVTERNMPRKVLGKTMSTARVKAVRTGDGGGTITTLLVTSSEVPGGVVNHSSKEQDKDGHSVRRSTLELIGFGLEPEPETVGLFGRRRTGLLRKPKPVLRYVPR